jgi:hypothetical protein
MRFIKVQLTLLIEIKKYKDIAPQVSLLKNNLIELNSIIATHQNKITLEVIDTDIVSIVMQGKNQNDTEIVDGKIISDKSVILNNIYLEGLEYKELKKCISYFDNNNNLLGHDNYMYKNGRIDISINKLIHQFPSNIDEVIKKITLEQMILEVLETP